MNVLYCIACEKEVKAEESLVPEVEFIHAILDNVDTGVPYPILREVDWCEFPQGYTFCAPPPSLAEELDSMDTMDFLYWSEQNDPELQIEAD